MKELRNLLRDSEAEVSKLFFLFCRQHLAEVAQLRVDFRWFETVPRTSSRRIAR